MILPPAHRHFLLPTCRSLAEHELNVDAHLATLRWMRTHVDAQDADSFAESVTALQTARIVYWSTVWASLQTRARFHAHHLLEAHEPEPDEA